MFDVLQREHIDVPVIHHIRFVAGTVRDEIVIKTGSWLGGMLVSARMALLFGDAI